MIERINVWQALWSQHTVQQPQIHDPSNGRSLSTGYQHCPHSSSNLSRSSLNTFGAPAMHALQLPSGMPSARSFGSRARGSASVLRLHNLPCLSCTHFQVTRTPSRQRLWDPPTVPGLIMVFLRYRYSPTRLHRGCSPRAWRRRCQHC